jgi:hypothetical protein
MYIKNRAKICLNKGLCVFAKSAIFLICILEKRKDKNRMKNMAKCKTERKCLSTALLFIYQTVGSHSAKADQRYYVAIKIELEVELK